MTQIYHWSGLDLQGKHLRGEMTASSSREVKHLLQGKGLLQLSVRRRGLFTITNKIPPRDIILFFRQFATIIAAGIPLLEGLTLLLQTLTNVPLRNLLEALRNDIASGKNLSTACNQYPQVFDWLTRQLLQISEHTGRLDTMLLRISAHQEKSWQLKNKIRQALFYPVILCTVALLVSLTLLLVVVPQFEIIFQSFHGNLPRFTRQVIALSLFVRHYYWLAIVPGAFLIITLHYYKKSHACKLTVDKLLLTLPAIGQVIKNINLARFARVFATLTSAGVPLHDILNLLLTINRNAVFQNAAQTIQTQVLAGNTLHKSLQTIPVFAGLITQMVKVGEDCGTLDTMLEKTAAIYEGELEYWIANFNQLLEPLIIVILGVLIGGLVIAMYLPIFKLGTML
jgi:type IV pilus assembly protein PilC